MSSLLSLVRNCWLDWLFGEGKVERFRDENESCAFGQKLTFPIMKANCEPELPEMVKLLLFQ